MLFSTPLRFWKVQQYSKGQVLDRMHSLQCEEMRGWGRPLLATNSGENHQGDGAFCPFKDGNRFFMGDPFQTLPVDSNDLVAPFETPIFRGCSLQLQSSLVTSPKCYCAEDLRAESNLLRGYTQSSWCSLGAPEPASKDAYSLASPFSLEAQHWDSNGTENSAVNSWATRFFGCSAQQLVRTQINKEYLGTCLWAKIL